MYKCIFPVLKPSLFDLNNGLTEPWPGVPEQLSVPGDQTEGIIRELTPATAYHLRVTAQNTLGLGTPSEVIQAATDEEGEYDKVRMEKVN